MFLGHSVNGEIVYAYDRPETRSNADSGFKILLVKRHRLVQHYFSTEPYECSSFGKIIGNGF